MPEYNVSQLSECHENLEVFNRHWDQLNHVISCENLSESAIKTVFTLAKQLVDLVVDNLSVTTCTFEHDILSQPLGPCGEAFVRNRLWDKLLIWVEGEPSSETENLTYLRGVARTRLLSLFEDLVACANGQLVLTELCVLRPLLQFLFKLSSQLRPPYEQAYGRTLYELCVLLCRDPPLLHVCRKACDDLLYQPFIVFSWLVPLMHRGDAVGDWAKDALLLVFDLSSREDTLGSYLAFQSDICPVLATGLSGLYSSLPKKLVPRYRFTPTGVDSPGGPVTVTTSAYVNLTSTTPCIVELPVGDASWHQLSESEWHQSTDLCRFLHTLDFCNLVLKIAHRDVRKQLLHFIHSGFLVPVLGSALHQSALDEVVAATAYLELFLRRLTEPQLIKLFLQFVVSGSYDGYPILSSLINRLNANAALGMVTLSLFRTILSFHCEDVMYELVFRHLASLHHIQTDTSFDVRSRQSSMSVHSLTESVGSPPPNAPSVCPVELVQSGDRFLAFAITSAPPTNRSVPNSGQYARYLSALSGKETSSTVSCPPSDSQTTLNPDPSVNNSNHAGESNMTRIECSTSSCDTDWVVVQNIHSSFTPPETPSLIPYLETATRRIQQTSHAVNQRWNRTYLVPPDDASSQELCQQNSPLDDKLLHNVEEDRSPEWRPPKRLYNAPHTVQPDLPDFRPSGFTARSRVHTSSMYQLNYLDDLSDEEVLDPPDEDVVDNDPVSPSRSINQGCSNRAASVDRPDLARRSYSPSSNYDTPSPREVPCTCPTQPPNLSDQLLGSNRSHPDSSFTKDELDAFLTLLDTLPLTLWQCPAHFDYLPVGLAWPEVDDLFLAQLDGYDEHCRTAWHDTTLQPPTSITRTALDKVVVSAKHQPRVQSNQGSSISIGSRAKSKTPIAGGIGPFLSILLNRLKNMHSNCFFTNLLLTDLLVALASYPCPLLYSFLLNSIGLQLKSNVNSMFKAIHSVNSQLLAGASSVDQWHALIYRARVYLYCGQPYASDTIVNPEFYSSHGRVPGQSGMTSTTTSDTRTDLSKRSNSADRTPLRPLRETRTVWLTSTPGEVQTSARRDQPQSDETDRGSLVLPSRPWVMGSDFLTPLLPVDQPVTQHEARRATLTTPVKPTGRASLGSSSNISQWASPTWQQATDWAQQHVNFKQMWPRSARMMASPKQSDRRRGQSTSSRPPIYRPRPTSLSDEEPDLEEPPAPEISTRTRNLIFGAIVFDEFCYELAALCYAHSVVTV